MTVSDRIGCEKESVDSYPIVIISPTRLNDRGMRLQETNIAALRDNLVLDVKINKTSGCPGIAIRQQMDNVLKEESVRKEILGDKLYKKMQKASIAALMCSAMPPIRLM